MPAPGRVVLLGDPVDHSLSPVLHGAAFRAAGIPARYLARRVRPDELPQAVAALRDPDVLGANVTIPHKEAVLPLLDALAQEARAIGAVNTIVRRADGGLEGHNTDAEGFWVPLAAAGGPGPRAVLFGAGGAARAVAYALLRRSRAPLELALVARNSARAEALAADLAPLAAPDRRLVVVAPKEARPYVRRASLLVNATPLGMHPRPEGTPWSDPSDFGAHQLAYDLVYVPRRTRFLAEAAARGARTLDGLAMLLGQAAEAFRLWTGRPMPTEAARMALEEALTARARPPARPPAPPA